MNYLIYVEHSAENLQFYLWHQDYLKRFKEANTSDIALAPEWTQAKEDECIAKIQKDNTENLRREQLKTADIFKGTDFEKKPGDTVIVETNNPFSTPPRTPGNSADHESMYTASNQGSNANTYRSQAGEAFTSAGIKQPCKSHPWKLNASKSRAHTSTVTIQPFREEINRVIATYIMNGAPRELNLSSREQKAVLQALAYTTHPSAFRVVFNNVDNSLRRQAHPNFIRWSICNGNPARVFFARGLGVSLIVAAFAAAVILTLSSAGRGWRALAAIGWVLGISTLVAAYKGMCVVLHGMHHRHVRPWELFVDHDEEEVKDKQSFDSFGSTNSYEEEPWIVKYDKRNIVRKIFDREVWIQEPALRQIQDTIFVQSMLASVLLAGILTAIFVPLPAGNFY
jgi:hypothetical protein